MLDYKKLIQEYDVISFDVFDTLLLRPFLVPSDLFVMIERRENRIGFARDRIAAEGEAYARMAKEGRKECTLDEIYSFIPQWRDLESFECQAEEESLVANPETLELYKYALTLGKQVIITSDMYLPGDFVRRQLQRNGFDGWTGFFLSSEQNAQKRTGELFAKILQKFSKDGVHRKVLHIGDNWDSDVIMAQQNGIRGVYYPKVVDRFHEINPFVGKFSDGDGRKRLIAGAFALGWHLFQCEHPDCDYWSRLGFLQAGFLGSMYVNWIADQCRKENVDHLMFVARDGYIWQKMAAILCPEIRSDYFYSSRMTALLVSEDRMSENWSTRNRREQILKVLIDECGVPKDVVDVEEYLDKGILPEEARCKLKEMTKNELCAYRAYLSGFDFDAGHSAVVDGCSLNGSGQKLVEVALESRVRTYYLLCLGDIENGKGVFNSPPNRTRFIDLCEFMFGAPTPPIKKIIDGHPVYKEEMHEYEKLKVAVNLQITQAAEAAALVVKKYGLNILPEDWLDWCDAFMDNLTSEDRVMLSQACNSGDVEHKSYKSVVWPNLARSWHQTRFKVPFLLRYYRKGLYWYHDYLLAGKIRVRRRVYKV